jgi:hypothetical protein
VDPDFLIDAGELRPDGVGAATEFLPDLVILHLSALHAEKNCKLGRSQILKDLSGTELSLPRVGLLVISRTFAPPCARTSGNDLQFHSP